MITTAKSFPPNQYYIKKKLLNNHFNATLNENQRRPLFKQKVLGTQKKAHGKRKTRKKKPQQTVD